VAEEDLPNSASNNVLYPLASMLDPSYGLIWLNDYPGTPEVKQEIKDSQAANKG